MDEKTISNEQTDEELSLRWNEKINSIEIKRAAKKGKDTVATTPK